MTDPTNNYPPGWEEPEDRGIFKQLGEDHENEPLPNFPAIRSTKVLDPAFVEAIKRSIINI